VRDQAFIDGHLRFADNPWFGYAAGAVLGGQNRWREAEAALELARTQPALAADTSIDLARLRRLRGGDQVALQDLTAASESLRNLLALEGDARMNSEGARSYAELAHGRVDAALKIARRWPAGEARVLRLAAASDGAEPALAARALDLPLDAGLDQNTLWSSIGLALRERRDPAPYLEFMRKLVGRDAEALEKVIGLLRAGAAPASVDQALIGLPIYARAQVCSIGVILRGKNAPRAWRDTARLALFATERPYFGKQSL